MEREIAGSLLIAIGGFFLITFQGWGFWLIRCMGPERALGAANVRRRMDRHSVNGLKKINVRVTFISSIAQPINVPRPFWDRGLRRGDMPSVPRSM